MNYNKFPVLKDLIFFFEKNKFLGKFLPHLDTLFRNGTVFHKISTVFTVFYKLFCQLTHNLVCDNR